MPGAVSGVYGPSPDLRPGEDKETDMLKRLWIAVATLGVLLASGRAPVFSQAGQTQLTVSINGSGSGSVASAPLGIRCQGGGDSVGTSSTNVCSAAFANGTPVTLHAASSTARFAGWSGDGACAGTGDCTLALTGGTRAITATFERPTLTVSTTGSGTVINDTAQLYCPSNCALKLRIGTKSRLSANPGAGYRFDGWSGGTCSGTEPTCNVTVTADTTVAAAFGKPVLTVTKAGAGTGTVTSSPSGINCGATCRGHFEIEKAVTLTAAASAPDSKCVGWSGPLAASCSGTECAVKMAMADEGVTATFKKLVKVSVTVGAGGGVSVTGRTGQCDGSRTCPVYFDNGETVTLTAHPAAGKRFGQWGAQCAGSGRSSTCTFTIASGQQLVPVTASFCTPSTNPTNPC